MISRRLYLLGAFALAVTRLSAADSTFLKNAMVGFDQWDKNKDGSVSVNEIEAAIASQDVKGEQAAAAVALRRVAKNKQAPIEAYTKDDIKRMSGSLAIVDSRDNEDATTDEERKKPANFNGYYEAAMKKINARQPLFVGTPKLDGFKQGRLGSCFCLAPLTALIYSDPKAASTLIKPSADGTKITVTFGKDNAVVITPITDGELALATTTGENGIWAATYEKAVGQLRMSDKAAEEGATPLSTVSKGGSAGTMLSVLTGKEIKRYTCKPWFEDSKATKADQDKQIADMRIAFKAATADHRLMTGGTSGKTRKVPSLSRGHAYALLGYDAKTDMVTLRDPHGQTSNPEGDGTPNMKNGYVVKFGIFKAPLTEAVQFMAGFAVALDAPAKTKGYGTTASATAVD